MDDKSQTGAHPADIPASPAAWPALEPLIFVALAFAYVWVVQPTHNHWLKLPFISVVVVLPFASNLFHRDPLRDLGLRLDNFLVSAREVGIVTVIGVIVVVGIGQAAGSGLTLHRDLFRFLLLYPFWGLAQQYAMQSFTYRRIRESTRRPRSAALLTAFLFASVHYPNLALASLTLVGGYVWCRLFERHPNLITLAVSHGWLAVLLRYSWPAGWLHNLRIGPGFWTWTP